MKKTVSRLLGTMVILATAGTAFAQAVQVDASVKEYRKVSGVSGHLTPLRVSPTPLGSRR